MSAYYDDCYYFYSLCRLLPFLRSLILTICDLNTMTVTLTGHSNAHSNDRMRRSHSFCLDAERDGGGDIPRTRSSLELGV